MDYLMEEAGVVSELLSSITLWITLKKARINDGSNFNLSVQEEYVDRMNDIGNAMGLIMDWITECHNKRGGFIQNVGERSRSEV